jgi:hypothetical protein
MKLKQQIIKKLIEWDLLPCSIRWKKSVSGIGRMYADIMVMMQKEYGVEGVKKLSNVMYNIGFNQTDEILDILGLERNLEGCAYALLAMHRIFGIKSKIVRKENNKIVIHVTKCYWGKSKKGWTPKTCASIAQYETGLVKGILPNATHIYTKRRSLGHDVCELIIAVKKGDQNE